MLDERTEQLFGGCVSVRNVLFMLLSRVMSACDYQFQHLLWQDILKLCSSIPRLQFFSWLRGNSTRPALIRDLITVADKGGD